MKEIHVLLDKESYEDLLEIRAKIFKDNPKVLEIYGEEDFPPNYEEYLERERKKPTKALFG